MTIVADPMAETLAAAGGERIDRVMGDGLSGALDALCRHGGIQRPYVRREEGAALHGGCRGALTHELAVGAGSGGPGNLDLINGLVTPS